MTNTNTNTNCTPYGTGDWWYWNQPTGPRYYPATTNVGWVCPKCSRCLAPFITSCPFCVQPQVTWTYSVENDTYTAATAGIKTFYTGTNEAPTKYWVDESNEHNEDERDDPDNDCD